MFRRSRLRDRDDAILAKHPGKRHLRRGHFVVLRQMPHDGMRKQSSLLDWRVGHDWNTSPATPWQQIKLDAAPGEVVQHLISRSIRSAFQRKEFLHVAYIKITDSPVA